MPLPPSPPSDPILGHLRYIPPKNPELQYAEWAKVYGKSWVLQFSHLYRPHHMCSPSGDVLYLHILGRPVIILNSAEAAIDLLEKRAENYSDRPNMQIFEL